jgi:hypothetical protein
MSSNGDIALCTTALHNHVMPKPAPTRASSKKTAAAKKRMPPDGTRQALFYLPAGMLDGLDAWAAKLSAKGVGPAWSRSDVVRAALQRALDERAAKDEAP